MLAMGKRSVAGSFMAEHDHQKPREALVRLFYGVFLFVVWDILLALFHDFRAKRSQH